MLKTSSPQLPTETRSEDTSSSQVRHDAIADVLITWNQISGIQEQFTNTLASSQVIRHQKRFEYSFHFPTIG